jgi:pimeloyl-ACP methyl ester carboxylesterase
MADDVETVARQLGLACYVLVGHSMGYTYTTKSRTGDMKTSTSVAENDLRRALARVAQGV